MKKTLWVCPLAGAALIGAMLTLACLGCGSRSDRKKAEKAEPARSHYVAPPPAYPPSCYGGSPPPAPAGFGADASFLADLQRMSQNKAHCKYILDKRRNLYHWWDCPQAPRAEETYTLDARGRELVHRKTVKVPYTHLSREEIKAKGYKPCPYCRPDLDTPSRELYRGRALGYRERQALPY